MVKTAQKTLIAPTILPSIKKTRQTLDLHQARTDLYFLGKEILGYEDAEDVPHKELCAFIEGPEQYKLLVGARGIYKTSFGTIARAIQVLLQDANNRALIVQNTTENACMSVSEIRDHFESNEKLRNLCPGLIPEKVRSKKMTRWSNSALQLNRPGIYSEPSISAAGVETQLARRHYTHILGDDVVAASRDDLKEGGIIILRPEEVEKAIGWYILTMHGLSIIKRDRTKRTQVQFIVNRWGVKDFAQHIIDNHLKTKERPDGFAYKVMGTHREDGSLLWPGVLSEEELDKIEQSQGSWMKSTQYDCKPYAPSDRGFQPDWNVYWEGKYPPGYEDGKRKYRIYALMDIADQLNPANCKTAMVVLFVDEVNHIWVGEAIDEKIDTVAKLKLMRCMINRYEDLNAIHIEENLHKDTLKHVVKNDIKEHGIYYGIRPLKHKNRNKDSRILRLQPHHERGAIHIKKSHKHLLQQMRDFPFSGEKDLLDALGYIMDFIRGPVTQIKLKKPEYKRTNSISGKQIMEDIEKTSVIRWGGGPFKLQGRSTG